MKKSLLFVTALAALFAPCAGAAVVKSPQADAVVRSAAKAAADLSTVTPDGTYAVYQRAGHSYMDDWGSLMLMPVDGFVAEIVYGAGNTAYVRNPLTYVNNNVWVAATVSADGKSLSIEPGTVIAIDPYTRMQLALYNCEFDNTAEDLTVTPDTDSPITYTISDDGLTVSLAGTSVTGTPEEPQVVHGIGAFLVEEDNAWAGFMDFLSVYTKMDVSPVTAPAGVAATQCALVCENADAGSIDLDNLQGRMVNVAVDGADIYVQGLVEADPKSWAKGVIEGAKARFDNAQFLTVTNGYMLYFTPATHETTVNPDWGFTTTTFTPTKQAMTFDWDADAVALTAPSADILISTAVNSSMAFNRYISPVIRRFEDVAATPKTPAITAVQQYEGEEGPYYAVAIRTSDFSVDDAYMDRSQLYYRVFVDGAAEPFVFSPDEYPGLQEPITDVPLTMNTDDFISSASYQNFYLFRSEVSKIEVQVLYKGGGTDTCSDKAVWQNAGVTDVPAPAATDPAAPVYDLCGRRISPTTPGIQIRSGQKYLNR